MNWNYLLGRLGHPCLAEMKELHLMCENKDDHTGLSEQAKITNFVSFTSKSCWDLGMQYSM